MEIASFFDPVEHFPSEDLEETGQPRLGNVIARFVPGQDFPDYTHADIALIGVGEDRASVGNNGCAGAPDEIRKSLYKLFPGPYPNRIVDLGNIKPGNMLRDTYFALASTIAELVGNKVVPVILGGSQDLTYANYQAYQALGQIINIVVVDPIFDLGKSEQEITSQSYLSGIILHQPNYLFNFANIGYQTYLVDQDAVALMKSLFFDTYRLGMVRQNLDEVEPIVRNADLVSFDVSAIRQSDAPANGNASPNGFYGEEACQIARYAGLSDKLTSIGFYEVNPLHDHRGQTAGLVAQMIWYFIDGFYQRAHDFPFHNEEDYLKYRVSITDHKEEIIFLKSKKTDRWWMEIPLLAEQKIKFDRHYLVPCSYSDYQAACRDEIPDRWWMVYQKLM
jgi:arginase family enzyme